MYLYTWHVNKFVMKHDRMSDALGKMYEDVKLLLDENTYLYLYVFS